MTERVYIGIDFGDRRTGIAKSDPTGLIASPLKTITANNAGETVKQVLAIIEEHNPAGVVIGYPVSLSGGTAGERCRAIDAFIAILKKSYTGPIHKEDERFSSTEAEYIIHLHNQKIGKDKGRLDRMAAAIILQSFLDRSREKN
jgi:putative Holliday junction resolvase